MNSKNKPAQTALESRYVAIIAAMDCAICAQSGPSEVHEFEQGLWFASIPCCAACHRGTDGWHGTRLRWRLRKMTETKAINQTVALVFERVTRGGANGMR